MHWNVRNTTTRGLGLVLGAAVTVFASVAFGQQNTTSERVAAYRDWTVFNPSNPKECYVVTPPVASKAERGGQAVDVRRGDIRLFVTIRPDQGVDKEVSFTGGYPFRSNSKVRLKIGNTEFPLSVGDGESQEWAWPDSPSEDSKVVAAMRRGASAEVIGVSQRGTTTTDSFSLFGFTAALAEAERLCK